MGELVPGLSYDDFLQEAVRHDTESSFRESRFFGLYGAAIDALLVTPRFGGTARNPAPSGGSLRVAHWNIEKGKALPRLKSWFREDPWLSGADVITLNEVDQGMARSGPNADVVAELAAAHESCYVAVPNYIECTTGLDGEAPKEGRNETGLHGTAILSRLPILDTFVHPLPTCWDYFHFREKRFGGRRGLYLLLDWHGTPVIAATVHLEMRCAPVCRARQFRGFLDGLDQARIAWRNAPAFLTGDWNTHTFRRGSFQASLVEFLRIITAKPDSLDRELAWPTAREPLFADLRAAGFQFETANDPVPTAGQHLGRVEDLAYLPPWLGEAVLRASGLKGRTLSMRLDWIAMRGFEATAPVTLPAGPPGKALLSDHRPIGVNLRIADPAGLVAR